MEYLTVFAAIACGLTLLTVTFYSLRNHLQEQKVYATKLDVYKQNGGKPFVRFERSEAWEEQNEVNRKAREIAGLGEYVDEV